MFDAHSNYGDVVYGPGLNKQDESKLQTLQNYLLTSKSKTPVYLYNKLSFRTDIHKLNIKHRLIHPININNYLSLDSKNY